MEEPLMDKERIDRAIDMIEKVTTLALTKGHDINKLLKERSSELTKIPSAKRIKDNPDHFVPLLETELKILFNLIQQGML